MQRITLEDMRFNKKESKQTNLMDEVEFSSELKPKVDNINSIEEVKNEAKIDEYLKNRSSSRQRLQNTPQIKKRSLGFNKFILFFFIISLILGGVYWAGNIFQRSDITITSKHQIITYKNKQFIASKNLNDKAVDFEIMITSDKKSKKIILTEPKDVSIKAKGVVTLYNEFSMTPQKLLTKTFLMDNDGKTYNTDSAVTISGYKLDSNKKIIPGHVDVNITAFLPGEAYNGSPNEFHINGFKGTAKYNKFYGKLKTPLSGGASGLVYVLNDKDKSNIYNTAQSSFKDDLIKQVKAQVPTGYILYPDAMTFSSKTGEDVLSKTPEAEIPIEGTLSVVLLKEKSLMDNIIKISLPEISEGELKEIKIPDLSKFTFSFINKDQLIIKDMDSVSFSLTGDVDAIWSPDIEALKTKLIGIHKDNVLSVFRQDPGISSAIVKIFPPWQKYIPSDLSKINIVVK